MSNGNYLLLFTITPVQDFINQSRKLIDLYGSSEILSEMSEIGMKICKREGENIFPILQENKQISYPNRFLVKFKNKNIKEIKNIAKEIENNLKAYLKSFYKNIDINLPEKAQKTAIEHIENYFNFYWVIEEERESYKDAFDNIEKKLAAVKNTRIFSQLNQGEGEIGRKCSICGERNVVFVRGRDINKLWIEDPQSAVKINSFILKDKEGLCGVCFAKRNKNFKNSEKFPSIASIIYGDFDKVKEIENKLDKFSIEIKKELQKIINKKEFVNAAKLDIEVIINNDYSVFEDAVFEFFVNKEKMKKNKKLKKVIEELYNNFKEKFKNYFKKVSPYYAVILLDGDKMGKRLKGDGISDLENYHKNFSKILSNVAQELKNINKAVNVYAGGDDYLGFVNLENLFYVLSEIKCKWKKNFKNNQISFSAGVVIAHYKTPLRRVLEEVKKAEKYAKNEGRNRIAFYVLKRSGEKRRGVIKVNDLKIYKDIVKYLIELKDILSLDFIVDFEKEFWFMKDIDITKKIFKEEIERLINKKSQNKNNQKIKRVKESIFKLIDKMNQFDDFIGLLNILRFINRELRYVKNNGN